MTVIERYTCDCGCGKSAYGYEARYWIVLNVLGPRAPHVHDKTLQLGLPKHFSDLQCLKKYVGSAVQLFYTPA